MPLTLQRLTAELGLTFSGDAKLEIKGVASLSSARASDLCFWIESNHKKAVIDSQCSALIVPEGFDGEIVDKSLIYASNPQLSFARAVALITPALCCAYQSTGIHPTAQIAETASIGENVSIGALSVIGNDVKIGANTHIGSGCMIENHVSVGSQCYLHSRVTVANRVVMGDRCILHSGVVLGSDGFGLIEENRRWIKMPQIGTVVIGNEVEIGANTTVDRGTLDDTVIEEGCKLDNLIQIAHNVRIGAHTAIAACVGIAGSTVIGKNCKIAGAVGVLGHLSITDNVTVTAMSLVTKDIKQAGVYSSGTPLMKNHAWHKVNARYKSLNNLAKTVMQLDKQVR